MSNAAVMQQLEIFAANRARGVIAIGAGAIGWRHAAHDSARGRLVARPLSRACRPGVAGGAKIVNTAGGTAGGDRYDIWPACQAGAGADLTVSTAAAERFIAPPARMRKF